MKKRIFVLLVLALSLSWNLAADEKMVINGNFTGLRVHSSFNVELVYSRNCFVELDVQEEMKPYLQVEIEDNDILVLYMDFASLPKRFRHALNDGNWKVSARVGCPDIRSIRLSGAARLKVVDEFQVENLNIKASGASSLVTGLIEGDGRLEAEFSGASHGTMDLKGFTYADIDCSGASNVYFSGKKLENSNIEVSGASVFEVQGTFKGYVKVDASGASQVLLRGEAHRLLADIGMASRCNAADFLVDEAVVEVRGASALSVNAVEVDIVEIAKYAAQFENKYNAKD